MVSSGTVVSRFAVPLTHTVYTAIAHTICIWNCKASYEFQKPLAREAPQFQCQNQVRECSVQLANGTRNLNDYTTVS